MNQSLGMLEVTGLTPTLAAIDAMEKTADVRVWQCELNDYYGVCTKITGSTADVEAAIEAGRAIAEKMGGKPVADVVARPDREALRGIESPREYNVLIEQDVVFFPRFELAGAADGPGDGAAMAAPSTPLDGDAPAARQ